jgi:hypothetical protein
MAYAPNTKAVYFSIGVEHDSLFGIHAVTPRTFGRPCIRAHVTIGSPMDYVRAGILEYDPGRSLAVAEELEDQLGALSLAGEVIVVRSELRRYHKQAWLEVEPVGAVEAAHEAYREATRSVFGITLPFSESGYHMATRRRFRRGGWGDAPEACSLPLTGQVYASGEYRIRVNNVWRDASDTVASI